MKTILLFLLFVPITLVAQWNQLGQSLEGTNTLDFFGASPSMSADGNVMAVSSQGHDVGANNRGLVQVFEFNGTNWIQKGQDLLGEGVEDFMSRARLSNDGNRIVTSAYFNDANGTNAGHVRVYQFDGSSWVQMGQTLLGDAAGDTFGTYIDINETGDTIAVGAISNATNGQGAGQLKMFQFNGSTWVQLGQTLLGNTTEDFFGGALGLTTEFDTRVAVGAAGSDVNGNLTGTVTVYQLNGSTWEQLGTSIHGEGVGDTMGQALDLTSNGILAIGAQSNDGNGNNAGHVRIFEFGGTDWQQLGSDIDGVAAEDRFGHSLSLSRNGATLAIGARDNNAGGNEAGHIRVFEFNGANWTQKGSDINGTQEFSNLASVSLSADGSRLVAAAVRFEIGGVIDVGQVKVFQFGNPPINNNPGTATTLQIGSNFEQFDVIGNTTDATSSETILPFIENPNCANYLGDDVWYSITVPASGTITAETRMENGSDLTDTGMAFYNVNGIELACNDDETPQANLFSKIELTGQTPGDLLYIRVWGYNNVQEGAFKISAYNVVLGIDENSLVDIVYAPNPTRDFVTFTTSEIIQKIEIFNLLGQRVLTHKLNDQKATVDLSTQPTGTYIAHVESESSTQRIKIIKQ